MSTPRRRVRFQPDVLHGRDRATANSDFARQARELGLVWRCPDCAYQERRSGACTVGWPNEELRNAAEPIPADDGIPVFCKAFEAE